MIAQAGGKDGESPVDLLDDALDEPDRDDVEDTTPPPAEDVDRASWGRTPDAIAGQQRTTSVLPGGVE